MKAQRSPQVTPQMAAEIKAILAQGLYDHQSAAHFGINQGRAPEVNTGKLHPSVRVATQMELNFPVAANDRGVHMAKKTTGKKAVSDASDVLQDDRTGSKSKTAAGSSLSQVESRKAQRSVRSNAR